MANNSSKTDIKLSRLKPISANLNFRGFQNLKRKIIAATLSRILQYR